MASDGKDSEEKFKDMLDKEDKYLEAEIEKERKEIQNEKKDSWILSSISIDQGAKLSKRKKGKKMLNKQKIRDHFGDQPTGSPIKRKYLRNGDAIEGQLIATKLFNENGIDILEFTVSNPSVNLNTGKPDSTKSYQFTLKEASKDESKKQKNKKSDTK